ncbi:MAG: ATP-binding cassette domain-containing protein [Candidatus Solibacter usitatus]|nr:ATP-binding cassette domain-containing protein [Candidatus Solibacter usitatus]
MIQAKLSKRFAGFSLDVEFESSAGITVLFGPDGAGKTLVLDAIAGFAQPDAGRILLDDVILFDAAARVNIPPQRRNCSYLFRNHSLFPHLTLRENLMFAAVRRPRLERHRRVNEILERFELTGVSGERAHQISASQRLRGSLARVIIGGPRLLLLDQPWSGLDATLRRELHSLLRQIHTEFKIAMLLATGDLEECFELADEMLLLREGRLLQAGEPRKILDQPASLDAARMLGIPNLLEAEVIALDPGRNSSRLRWQDQELSGTYFPGRMLGDRVWLCMRAEELRVSVHNGSKPGINQVRAKLLRVSEKPQSLRLEFSGGIFAEVAPETLASRASEKEWLIEFPPQALRIL